MKRFIILAVVLVLPFIYSCASDEDVQIASATDYSDPEVVRNLIESDTEYYLVDVRTPEEYESGYIPTAENIPLDVIGAQPPTEEKDGLIVLYCRSGNRSSQAQAILRELGYTNVHNFGGIIDWPFETVTN